jgi:hypothetical protein
MLITAQRYFFISDVGFFAFGFIFRDAQEGFAILDLFVLFR